MHQKMEEKIWQLIQEYCQDRAIPVIWRKPVVRFADAKHPGFAQLKQIVDPAHHIPQDFLPEAKNVLCWFLPFLPEVGRNNLPGRLSSSQWADAYLVTNEMAAWINEHLVEFIKNETGTDAGIPRDAGMISMENPRSHWSQRHVAYLAGHGTFGLNNMLISDVGAVGRYFSVVTAMDVVPDQPVQEQRCLWKRNGSCGACVQRCEAGALTTEGFDRFRCLSRCLENMERYPGADVCGKCTVELPCSYEIPKFKGEMTMKTVTERFLKYVSFDTMSDEFSETCPSSAKQKLLGAALVEEMKEIGIRDAFMDENGYVYGTVPGDPALPTIGLIAHMDTSPDASGADIKAKIVEYNGGDVCLNEEKGIFLREADYPSLKRHHGKHLIVTDGTTLLGADDKAGIAEIMAAAEFLMTARMNHATLKIGFTPDEEIGRGADLFDVKLFGADYAYTADGGTIGEIEYENFNAAGAMAVFHGLNIHPGSAKDKMVNSQYIAMEFQSLLPSAQKPEHTEGYEGFIHLTDMEGEVEKSTLRWIIRDHDMEKFEEKKTIMHSSADFINAKYGAGTVELTMKDSYFNMKKCIEPCMHIVEKAKSAMKAVGMKPKEVPIRGGTDGARLSYEGLPCPNLCTGGENYHGRFEYIPVEDMELCVKMLVEILTTA